MAGQNDITLRSGHATPENIVLRDLPVAAAPAGTTIYLYAGHATPENIILGDPTVIREAVGGGTTHDGEASITATASVTADGLAIRGGASAITGTGAVAAGAAAARAVAASISGTGAVAATPVAARAAAASLTGTGSVAAEPVAARSASASIAGSAIVAAAPGVARTVTAEIAGSAVVAATAGAILSASCSISGTAIVTADGAVVSTGTPAPVPDPPSPPYPFTSAHYGDGGPHDGASRGREMRSRTAPVEYEDLLFQSYGPPSDIAPMPDAPVESEPTEPAAEPTNITNRLAGVLRAIDAENAARRRLDGALWSLDEIDAQRRREAQSALDAHERESAGREAEDEDAAILILLTMA